MYHETHRIYSRACFTLCCCAWSIFTGSVYVCLYLSGLLHCYRDNQSIAPLLKCGLEQYGWQQHFITILLWSIDYTDSDIHTLKWKCHNFDESQWRKCRQNSVQSINSVKIILPFLSYTAPKTHIALWRHDMELFPALLAICTGNLLMAVYSTHNKGPVTRALMFSLMSA